ncbi:aspartate aminotransferase [Dunaliella salina]|uniref:Aspartate aminotransferase n=1 Tax=Dunaliella salina TaxID=3046 RepID=A0ABQ7GS98_DUNSA|nr:aspartate aminotransferase [Dunaliella salina]|eukprot:KAF5837448.1 aspartate aminotransferase [Dunaliella salina]
MLPISRQALKLASLSTTGLKGLSTSSAASISFAHVPEAPKDPILGITEAFVKDPNPNKINLGVGAYRDDDCKPVVLESVREAERRVAGTHYMEYLPMGGMKEFVQESIKLAYGDDAKCLKEGNVAAVQSLSGTGSCRLMADFMKRFMPNSEVYISVPTWANHHNIWRDANVGMKSYRYYKPETRGLDFEGFMEDLSAAPRGSVFLLHACAHNPTGMSAPRTPGAHDSHSHDRGAGTPGTLGMEEPGI